MEHPVNSDFASIAQYLSGQCTDSRFTEMSDKYGSQVIRSAIGHIDHWFVMCWAQEELKPLHINNETAIYSATVDLLSVFPGLGSIAELSSNGLVFKSTVTLDDVKAIEEYLHKNVPRRIQFEYRRDV